MHFLVLYSSFVPQENRESGRFGKSISYSTALLVMLMQYDLIMNFDKFKAGLQLAWTT